jgi:hypothetical protein
VKNKARRAGVSVVGISFENNFYLVKIYIDGLRGFWNGRLRASWRKSFLLERGAGKNKKSKGIDHFWNCHMVSTPLAPLPSGTDLKRIFKNVGNEDETSLATTGSQ